jgi:hypothetical protein
MTIKNEIYLFFQDIEYIFIGLYKCIQKHFNLTYFIIAVIHFVATFYTDPLIFEYTGTDFEKIIFLKRLFLVVIVLLWQFAGILIKNYSKSKTIQDLIKFSGIYFLIILTVHVLLWPFIIGDQMYYIYFADSVYCFDALNFQGIVIKYFRIYALMLIPNLAGIIIMQLLIISLVLGYIMTMLKEYFKLDKAVYFFYIPFLTPLVLQYNLHMEKDILYSYFFMLLFARLIFVRLKSQTILVDINIINLALISSVAASFRSAGILLLVATPLMFYLLNYKILKLHNMLVFLFFTILFSFIFIPHYVKTVMIDRDGNAYKNVYILNKSFQKLLEKAVEDKNKDILADFNKSDNLRIQQILKSRIHNVGFYANLSKFDKQQFKVISRKLMKTYFWEFVKFKFSVFYDRLRPAYLTRDLNDIKYRIKYAIQHYHLIKKKIVYLNQQIYSDTIELFKKYNSNISNSFKNYLPIWYTFIYFSIFTMAVLLKLKRIIILVCFLVFFLIIQILIVPYQNFRFFFQGYITAYLLFGYILFYLMCKKQAKFKK